jgi:hypothetical protein
MYGKEESMHTRSDCVLLELVWTVLTSLQQDSNHIIHHIKMLVRLRGEIMTDPEIRINILREESELHIFIHQLADLTPHEIAALIEYVAQKLHRLTQKPF